MLKVFSFKNLHTYKEHLVLARKGGDMGDNTKIKIKNIK